MIIMMAGLPGTGKSTLANHLANLLPAAVLNKDDIRAALFKPPYIEYSQAQDDFCQQIMLQTCGYLRTKNSETNIILDGRTFSRQYQRHQISEFASQLGTCVAIVECVCSEQVALARLTEAIMQKTHPAANRTADLYHQVRSVWEPIDGPRLVVNTDSDLQTCLAQALQYFKKIAVG